MHARTGTLLVAALVFGCAPAKMERALAGPKLAHPVEPQQKCREAADDGELLLVELPHTERASLEAQLASGVVPVRFEGCSMRVLRRCELPRAQYQYRGVTAKREQVRMRDLDELYARLPLAAAKLEGELKRGRTLEADLVLVGVHRAPDVQPALADLFGACEGATHVVSTAHVGAYVFRASESGTERAEVATTVGIGAGAKSDESQNLLSKDGEPEKCQASTTRDTAPPSGCGALLRVELTRLACPEGTEWKDRACRPPGGQCPPGFALDQYGGCSATRSEARMQEALDEARQHVERSDYPAARVALERFFEITPQGHQLRAEGLLLLGHSLANDRSFKKAHEVYRQVFEGFPNSPLAHEAMFAAARAALKVPSLGCYEAMRLLGGLAFGLSGVDQDLSSRASAQMKHIPLEHPECSNDKIK